MTTTKRANVLWTSGWDSTYRISNLLLVRGETVQPWYVMDSARMSAKRELKTLKQMRALLIKKDPSVAERLLPLEIFRVESIPVDSEITRSYQKLRARSHLGSQYDWLARLAKAQDVTLELSIHKDDKAHGFLEGLTVADVDGVHHLVPGAKVPVFERFRFPLFDMTKLEMQQAAVEDGFADVLERTWFCFLLTLDGKPCGFCNPCRYTREEGLGRRVSDPSRSRLLQYLVLSAAWKIRNKVLRLVPGISGSSQLRV